MNNDDSKHWENPWVPIQRSPTLDGDGRKAMDLGLGDNQEQSIFKGTVLFDEESLSPKLSDYLERGVILKSAVEHLTRIANILSNMESFQSTANCRRGVVSAATLKHYEMLLSREWQEATLRINSLCSTRNIDRPLKNGSVTMHLNEHGRLKSTSSGGLLAQERLGPFMNSSGTKTSSATTGAKTVGSTGTTANVSYSSMTSRAPTSN